MKLPSELTYSFISSIFSRVNITQINFNLEKLHRHGRQRRKIVNDCTNFAVKLEAAKLRKEELLEGKCIFELNTTDLIKTAFEQSFVETISDLTRNGAQQEVKKFLAVTVC